VSITASSKFANIDISPNGPTRAALDKLSPGDRAKAVTLIRKHLAGPLDELAAIFQNSEELQQRLRTLEVQSENVAVS
jgi:hypothetical protein